MRPGEAGVPESQRHPGREMPPARDYRDQVLRSSFRPERGFLGRVESTSTPIYVRRVEAHLFKVDPAVFGRVARDLGDRGFSVVTDFFPPEFCRAVRLEIEGLRGRGELRAAAIGRADGRRSDPETRGDGTAWLEPADSNASAARRTIGETLDGLRMTLNEALFLGLWDWEGHYAWYAPGTFYRTHLDRFRDESRRTVSVVFFFNPEWKDSEEGCLRLELPDGETCPELHIAPRAGTAVFFLSDRIFHEVLPTQADRYSFAGWLRTRAL